MKKVNRTVGSATLMAAAMSMLVVILLVMVAMVITVVDARNKDQFRALLHTNPASSVNVLPKTL